jgi:hypothetical protein
MDELLHNFDDTALAAVFSVFPYHNIVMKKGSSLGS